MCVAEAVVLFASTKNRWQSWKTRWHSCRVSYSSQARGYMTSPQASYPTSLNSLSVSLPELPEIWQEDLMPPKKGFTCIVPYRRPNCLWPSGGWSGRALWPAQCKDLWPAYRPLTVIGMSPYPPLHPSPSKISLLPYLSQKRFSLPDTGHHPTYCVIVNHELITSRLKYLSCRAVRICGQTPSEVAVHRPSMQCAFTLQGL